MVSVKLLPPLNQLAGSDRLQIELDSSTVGDLVESLIRLHPALAGELGAEANGEEVHYSIFVNGQDVRALQSTHTPLTNGDEVIILMAMAGGACGIILAGSPQSRRAAQKPQSRIRLARHAGRA